MANKLDVGKILDTLRAMVIEKDAWLALAEIRYEGFDAEAVLRALVIRYKLSGHPATIPAAIKDPATDISMDPANITIFWGDIIKLGVYGAKLGNSTKKVNKIPKVLKAEMEALFKKYGVENAEGTVPGPDVVTVQRVLAIFPFLVSIYIEKGVMTPIVKVAGLPDHFAHPQAWGVMNAAERVANKAAYEAWLIAFYRKINRKKLSTTPKKDPEIAAEQWEFTALQENDFEGKHRAMWAAVATALCGKVVINA